MNEKMIPHVIGAGATSLQDLERENIYKAILDDEDIELADRLVVAMAGGGLKSLYRNCSEVLTSQGGSLMFSKWSDEMIEMAKGCTADNIQAEGMFSKVDRTMRHGINFYMTTAAGIVVAKDGKLFNGVPQIWKVEHTKALIDLSMGNKEMFHMEAIQQEQAQEEANRMKLKERQDPYARKTMKDQHETFSYFGMPRIREITSETLLRQVVERDIKTKGDKIIFLKNFINTFVIGFGYSHFYKPLSSTKDKSVGTYDDLFERARLIVREKLKPPSSPPVKLVQLTNPSEFGLKVTGTYKVAVEKCENNLKLALDSIIKIGAQYGVNLLFPWNALNRPYWHQQLTPLQQRFHRDAKFRDVEEDTTYVSAGLTYVSAGLTYVSAGLTYVSYDTKEKDYYLYYYEDSHSPPKTTSDSRIHYTPFETTSVIGGRGINHSWAGALTMIKESSLLRAPPPYCYPRAYHHYFPHLGFPGFSTTRSQYALDKNTRYKYLSPALHI